jgi:hypothetical protein
VPTDSNWRAHTRFPDESSFTPNTSSVSSAVNAVVPDPGSKSTVSSSSKMPVTYTLPEASTAIPSPASPPEPDVVSNALAHTPLPSEATLITKASSPPPVGSVIDDPEPGSKSPVAEAL